MALTLTDCYLHFISSHNKQNDYIVTFVGVGMLHFALCFGVPWGGFVLVVALGCKHVSLGILGFVVHEVPGLG